MDEATKSFLSPQRRVLPRIITQCSFKVLKERWEPDTNLQEQRDSIIELATKAHADIRGSHDYHAKFFIFDHEAVLCSANLAENSLNGNLPESDVNHKDHWNYELGIVFFSEALFRPLVDIFDLMWTTAEMEYRPATDDFADISRKPGALVDGDHSPTTDPTIVWTFVRNNTRDTRLLDSLVALVESATDTIFFSAMWYRPVLKIQIALANALKSGKKVTVLVRKENREEYALVASKLLGELRGLGARIRVVPQNHAKYLVVDGRRACIFTSNIEEKGLETGVELGTITSDAQLVSEIQSFAREMESTSRDYF